MSTQPSFLKRVLRQVGWGNVGDRAARSEVNLTLTQPVFVEKYSTQIRVLMQLRRGVTT